MNVTIRELFLDVIHDLPKRTGKLFYLVNPQETTFEFPHQVPDYYQQIWLPFFLLLILELILLGKKGFRVNDQVTSLSHWILHETVRFLSRGAEYAVYFAIYEKFGSKWNLRWDSPWTWYITFIVVDFCYYWAHRCNHEVHFLWSYHQVHHSSEEFNLAVGIRQSVLQHWCNFIFYLLLAFFIPPSHFLVHYQLNMIYQLWIHTTVIRHLGVLELFLNTPNHHRVHHGCNLYCLDKNYGGVLIIWDRLFGTFQAENQEEEIVYGIVINADSFNVIYLQLFYLINLIKNSASMDTWADKLAVFWKGPSWLPGTPRLGLDEFKIKVKPRLVYDPYVPSWQKVYVSVQFLTVFFNHYKLYELENVKDPFTILTLADSLVSFLSIGLLLDKSAFTYTILTEFVRCTVYLYFIPEMYQDSLVAHYTYYVHMIQLFFIWLPHLVYIIYKYFSRTFAPKRARDVIIQKRGFNRKKY